MKNNNVKNKVVLAFSGGLDTTFCALYLKEQGFDVITVTVDTGGFSAEDITAINKNAKKVGVYRHVFVDGQKELYEKYVAYIIKGNILRGGNYPLSAGTERLIIAEKVAEVAKKYKAKFVAHGSTGAGNDQIRFNVALNVLAPKLKIIAPVRDLGLKRSDEVKFLEKYNIDIKGGDQFYSVNKSILGVTIGGQETLDSWSVPNHNKELGITPISKTPNVSSKITIKFEKGLPISVNGKKMDGLVIMKHLTEIGAKHGIGKGIHTGTTILGIKGRILFAAPAALILINAHRELEKLVFSKWQIFWKEKLADFYGALLHEGQYFDNVMRDIEALIDSSQQYVSGEVKIDLYKGNITVEGVRSPYSLMNRAIATYGEENLMWSGADVEGFSKIYALSNMLSKSSKNGGRNEKD